MTSEASYCASARKAYEAGIAAKSINKPSIGQGWAYPRGRYYWYFCQGYDGKPLDLPTFRHNSAERYDKMRAAEPISIDDIYAEGKARKLIAEEFRQAGQEGHAMQYEKGGFTTAPLRAFMHYIASRE